MIKYKICNLLKLRVSISWKYSTWLCKSLKPVIHWSLFVTPSCNHVTPSCNHVTLSCGHVTALVVMWPLLWSCDSLLWSCDSLLWSCDSLLWSCGPHLWSCDHPCGRVTSPLYSCDPPLVIMWPSLWPSVGRGWVHSSVDTTHVECVVGEENFAPDWCPHQVCKPCGYAGSGM